MNWYDITEYCEKTYGVRVSYEENEEYFVCPICDEPIYKSDWENDEDCLLERGICPVCEEQIVDE